MTDCLLCCCFCFSYRSLFFHHFLSLGRVREWVFRERVAGSQRGSVENGCRPACLRVSHFPFPFSLYHPLVMIMFFRDSIGMERVGLRPLLGKTQRREMRLPQTLFVCRMVSLGSQFVFQFFTWFPTYYFSSSSFPNPQQRLSEFL